MRIWNTIPSTLERIWRWTWSIDSGNGIASYKRGYWRLLVKDFKSKPIKEWGKVPIQHLQDSQSMRKSSMAQQFITAPTLPNPYVTCTLNNMKLVKTMNDKKKD